MKTTLIRIRYSTLQRFMRIMPPLRDESVRAYFDRVCDAFYDGADDKRLLDA